jgi:hypothetical protein
MTTDPDLAALRERYPGWEITSHWITSASRPDLRILLASRGKIRLAALSAAALAEQIEQHPGR